MESWTTDWTAGLTRWGVSSEDVTWAAGLRPTFEGPVGPGRFGCLICIDDGPTDTFYWSFGYGPTLDQARAQAVSSLADQRADRFGGNRQINLLR